MGRQGRAGPPAPPPPLTLTLTLSSSPTFLTRVPHSSPSASHPHPSPLTPHPAPRTSSPLIPHSAQVVRDCKLPHGGHAKFTCLYEKDTVALPRLVEQGKRIQFCFIDGLHTFDYTLLDAFFADQVPSPPSPPSPPLPLSSY